MKNNKAPLSERTAPERWFPTPREYNHAVSKLKRNKAADAGGWTTETAQGCMDHPRLKQTVLNWLHAHATATEGPAPRRGLWRTRRLVRLDKGGGAIRPILIGTLSLWSKLLSHLLLQPAKSDLEVFLRDRQFGIGPPQGEHRSESAPSRQPVVACLDFKNAFGTIDRDVCTKVLRELCPHNPAWLDAVNVLLAEPALVINPHRDHMAMTYDGLPRGDPLSTLVFSLATTEVIHKAVKTTTSEVKTLSYIDDTVLAGPADDIADILQTLPRAIQDTGLSRKPNSGRQTGTKSHRILTSNASNPNEGPPGSHHLG